MFSKEEFQHHLVPNLVSLRLEEIARRNIQIMDVSSLETVSSTFSLSLSLLKTLMFLSKKMKTLMF
jgi:hypothetical protein